MAIRLSRTITTSVADLYEATQQIDRGVLNHRIGVTRTDQLAELSRSFNKMTDSLQRLLEDNDDPVHVQLAANQVKFAFANVELISKLVEGKFPDFQRVIPKGYKNAFTIDRVQLQQALQRTAILTTDKFKGVRCILGTHMLKISSTNADQEEAQEELELDYSGDALDIGFNATYLLEILRYMPTEELKLTFKAPERAATLEPEAWSDASKYLCLVMPLRLMD